VDKRHTIDLEYFNILYARHPPMEFNCNVILTLSDLIQTIFEKTTLKRLRIGSIEP